MAKKKQFVKIPIEDMQFITACMDVFQATASQTYKADADKAYAMLHNGMFEVVEEEKEV